MIFDGAAAIFVDAIESSGQGGFAQKIINAPATSIEFTAFQSSNGGPSIQDDGSNDFAFAAADVSAITLDTPDVRIPSPATPLLLGLGLIGMIGFLRRRRIG